MDDKFSAIALYELTNDKYVRLRTKMFVFFQVCLSPSLVCS
jgi:hypothetical protein